MDGARVNIRPVGLSHAGLTFPKEKIDRHQLKISQATTLADLSEDYAWFSLALMYSRVRLQGRDPWGDYLQETGRSNTFQLTIQFDRPIFQGMEVAGDSTWNHVLWAMEKEDWQDYRQWMGQVSFVDRDQQHVTRLRTQEVQIADPLFLDKAYVLPAVLPETTVTVFVLDTNRGCIYVQPGQDRLSPPRIVQGQTTLPDTKLWAQAVLGGHPNPFGHVEEGLGVDPIVELTQRVMEARKSNEG